MPRMLRFWAVLLCLGFAAMTGAAQEAPTGTFTNPLLSSGADPQLTTFEGDYYLTYTTGSDIRVRRADSLERIGEAEEQIVWSDTDAGRCCNVWAPELHRLRGPDGWRWYAYYTAGPAECCANQRMHVLESEADDPLGPYRYKARLFDSEHDFWAIDPTVFKAGEASYVIWSGTPQDMMLYEKPQYLYIAKLRNPWTLEGPRVELSRPEYDWEKVDGEVNEGPAVLLHGDEVFLSFAASLCFSDDYKLGLMTAEVDANLLEPASWRKLPQPQFTRNDDGGAFGPGHNSFFKSPDGREDWFIYHANPSAGLGCGELRSPRVQRLTWGDDGLPEFGRPAPLDKPLPLPSGDGG